MAAMRNPFPKSFPAFFWTVLRRVIWDRYRADGRKPPGESLAQEHLSALVAEDNNSGARATAEVLDAVLTELPPDWVELLWEHYVDKIPQKKLAKFHGKSLSAIKMIFLRARRRGRVNLNKMGYSSFAGVAALDQTPLQRAITVSRPRPARSQPRPSCHARHHTNV